MPDGLECVLADEAATLAFGAALGRALQPGLYIALHGDLGAGKTTLVRGLLRGLGFTGRVKSPTFTLLELYPLSRFNLYHFDLYRFGRDTEWADAGFREYFNPQSVCLVEWPEKGGALLPDPDIDLRIEFRGEGRSVHCRARDGAGEQCLRRMTCP